MMHWSTSLRLSKIEVGGLPTWSGVSVFVHCSMITILLSVLPASLVPSMTVLSGFSRAAEPENSEFRRCWSRTWIFYPCFTAFSGNRGHVDFEPSASSPGRWKNPRGAHQAPMPVDLRHERADKAHGVHGFIQPGRSEPIDRSLSSSSPPLKRGQLFRFRQSGAFSCDCQSVSCCQYRLKRHRRERITLSRLPTMRRFTYFRLKESLCLAWSCRCWRAASTPLRPPDDFSERVRVTTQQANARFPQLEFVDASVE